MTLNLGTHSIGTISESRVEDEDFLRWSENWREQRRRSSTRSVASENAGHTVQKKVGQRKRSHSSAGQGKHRNPRAGLHKTASHEFGTEISKRGKEGRGFRNSLSKKCSDSDSSSGTGSQREIQSDHDMEEVVIHPATTDNVDLKREEVVYIGNIIEETDCDEFVYETTEEKLNEIIVPSDDETKDDEVITTDLDVCSDIEEDLDYDIDSSSGSTIAVEYVVQNVTGDDAEKQDDTESGQSSESDISNPVSNNDDNEFMNNKMDLIVTFENETKTTNGNQQSHNHNKFASDQTYGSPGDKRRLERQGQVSELSSISKPLQTHQNLHTEIVLNSPLVKPRLPPISSHQASSAENTLRRQSLPTVLNVNPIPFTVPKIVNEGSEYGTSFLKASSPHFFNSGNPQIIETPATPLNQSPVHLSSPYYNNSEKNTLSPCPDTATTQDSNIQHKENSHEQQNDCNFSLKGQPPSETSIKIEKDTDEQQYNSSRFDSETMPEAITTSHDVSEPLSSWEPSTPEQPRKMNRRKRHCRKRSSTSSNKIDPTNSSPPSPRKSPPKHETIRSTDSSPTITPPTTARILGTPTMPRTPRLTPKHYPSYGKPIMPGYTRTRRHSNITVRQTVEMGGRARTSLKDCIPIMPKAVAICCLIANIMVPGLGKTLYIVV